VALYSGQVIAKSLMAIGKRINVPTDFFAIHLGDMKVSDYVQRAADFARAFGTSQIGKFDD